MQEDLSWKWSMIAVRRIAGLVLLALLLAGCDSCGDFNNPLRGQMQSCRQQPPAQPSR